MIAAYNYLLNDLSIKMMKVKWLILPSSLTHSFITYISDFMFLLIFCVYIMSIILVNLSSFHVWRHTHILDLGTLLFSLNNLLLIICLRYRVTWFFCWIWYSFWKLVQLNLFSTLLVLVSLARSWYKSFSSVYRPLFSAVFIIFVIILSCSGVLSFYNFIITLILIIFQMLYFLSFSLFSFLVLVYVCHNNVIDRIILACSPYFPITILFCSHCPRKYLSLVIFHRDLVHI